MACLTLPAGTFGLCSHNMITCWSVIPPSTSAPVSCFFPHLHPELKWSKMEHSNYSLVELKIANNCVCVCLCGASADGPVFASALPWQQGFAGESLPFFSKCFFSLTSRKTVHTNAANCILSVVCCGIIGHSNMQI